MKITAVKLVYAVIVFAGIVYAFIALEGPNGVPALIEKRRLVRQYELTNEQLHREITQKQERIERLRDDPGEQEIEIRQRLKLAAPGEKVFILEEQKK